MMIADETLGTLINGMATVFDKPFPLKPKGLVFKLLLMMLRLDNDAEEITVRANTELDFSYENEFDTTSVNTKVTATQHGFLFETRTVRDKGDIRYDDERMEHRWCTVQFDGRKCIVESRETIGHDIDGIMHVDYDSGKEYVEMELKDAIKFIHFRVDDKFEISVKRNGIVEELTAEVDSQKGDL